MARLATRMFGIAATAAAVFAAAPAGAQAGSPTTCSATTAVAPSIRAESHTDAVGDIILSCSGGTPTPAATAVPTRTLTVFFNTPVTSRVLATPWAEPLLLIDEPGANSQLACQAADGNCTLQGVGGNGVAYDGSTNHPNVFQGQVSGSTQVTFANVPLDAGASGRVLRIVNLRVDAAALPMSVGATPVVAALSFSGGSPAISTPTPTVGFVQPGLAYSARTADGVAELSAPTALHACATQQVATLRYAETLGTAFKTRVAGGGNQNVPGTIYNSESDFFNTGLVGNAARGDLGSAGLADFGTRLKAAFDHVPTGASVFVPTAITGAHNEQFQLVAGETEPYSPVAPSGGGPAGTAGVAIAGGTGTAVWEVVKANPAGFDTADIPVYVASGPGSGTATVSGGFGPNVLGATVPSFAGLSAPTNLVTVAPCPVPGSGAGGAPKLSAVSLTNKRFRVARQPTPLSAKKKKAPRGTTFRFTLSTTAEVRIAIKRRASGLRKGRRCVAPTAKLKRAHAKRCKRFVTLGTLKRVNLPDGQNSVAFSGRLGRKALRPRSYKATLSAANTAGHPKGVTLSFRVVR
jgi:hypothetical protein